MQDMAAARQFFKLHKLYRLPVFSAILGNSIAIQLFIQQFSPCQWLEDKALNIKNSL